MPKCLVICLYTNAQGAQAECMELPPMTLPQSLLPEEAKFAGVGLYGEDDAYLYVVKGEADSNCDDVDAVLLDHLLTLAKKDAPQDFVLVQKNGVWEMESKELEQDVF